MNYVQTRSAVNWKTGTFGTGTGWQVSENRREWFKYLKTLSDSRIPIPNKVLADSKQSDGKSLEAKKAEMERELADGLRVDNPAMNYGDYKDLIKDMKVPNKMSDKKMGYAGAAIRALMYAFIGIVLVAGHAGKGITHSGTFTASQGTSDQGGEQTGVEPVGIVVLIVGLVLFFLTFGTGVWCDAMNSQSAFCKYTNFNVLGVLAIMGFLLPIVKNVSAVRAPLLTDPIGDLQLDSKFDYDPRVSDELKGRTIGLWVTWLVVLLGGILFSSVGHGSGIVSYFASDSARLFTSSLMLIQHVYSFWHDYSRFGKGVSPTPSLLNSQLPGWANAYVRDIILFIGDVMSLYPILYDYLTWKSYTNVDFLKHVDFIIVAVICFGAVIKGMNINDQEKGDARKNGDGYNSGALGFSLMVMVCQLLAHVVHDDLKISFRLALFAVFLFGICLYLYFLVAMNMTGTKPVVDGHLTSDMALMQGLTGVVITLQALIKHAEPRWVYPAGAATHHPMIYNFLKSLLGNGWSTIQGDKLVGHHLSDTMQQISNEDERLQWSASDVGNALQTADGIANDSNEDRTTQLSDITTALQSKDQIQNVDAKEKTLNDLFNQGPGLEAKKTRQRKKLRDMNPEAFDEGHLARYQERADDAHFKQQQARKKQMDDDEIFSEVSNSQYFYDDDRREQRDDRWSSDSEF